MPEENEDVVPEPVEETREDENILETLRAEIRSLAERLSACEARIGEHSHDGYAQSEHSHETTPPSTQPSEERRDEAPTPTHPYFRRIGDF